MGGGIQQPRVNASTKKTNANGVPAKEKEVKGRGDTTTKGAP